MATDNEVNAKFESSESTKLMSEDFKKLEEGFNFEILSSHIDSETKEVQLEINLTLKPLRKNHDIYLFDDQRMYDEIEKYIGEFTHINKFEIENSISLKGHKEDMDLI